MSSLRISHHILLFFLFLSLIGYLSCSDNKPNEPEKELSYSNNLTIGETTQELTEEIGSSGGVVKISNSGSVLNGMEITIPKNGYHETRTYVIESAQIKNHNLGEYFNPVSPMITIKNGGGYSEKPIQIKIPMKKNNNEFLMGFFYNELTGILDPLPIIELTDSYIVVETRHFALSNIISSYSLGKKAVADPTANLIISSIEESVLAGQMIISSGFSPGIDDWEFINYGSYIAPGGHCAGQSITAMWYFYEKKLNGEPSLFHRFDSLCNSEKPSFLWQDNPYGYRFCSTVQEDADWGNWVDALNLQSTYPGIVWRAFITAMLITGEPQLVIIRNSITGAGHAMIVYKINVTEGDLLIADPNYPNNRHHSTGDVSIRKISFRNNSFLPYPSYAKAGDPGIEFDQIAFYTKTSTFNWTKIGERYKELENKTIGNDRFPKYNLYLKTKSGDLLLNNDMTIDEDTLKVFCKNANIPEFLPGTDRLQSISIYNSNGGLVTSSNEMGIAKFIFVGSGRLKIGIYICGYKDGNPNKYYDFKWIYLNKNTAPTPNYKSCGIAIYCGTRHIYSTPDTSYETQNDKVSFSTWESYPGSFSGNTFNANYTKSWDSPTNPLTITGTISATFNSDYTKIITVDWSEEHTTKGGHSSVDFSGVDIPLDTYEWGTVYQVKAVESCNHIITLTDIQVAPDGLSYTMPEFWCNGDSKIYISFKTE